MAYSFNYKDAPLLEEREGYIPFKTGLQDYEGHQLECKIYRYKVAHDIAIEAYIPKIHPTTAYTRGFLLNEDGEVIAQSRTGLGHFQKAWLKDWLKTFNKKNKSGVRWVEDYRQDLIEELNNQGTKDD